MKTRGIGECCAELRRSMDLLNSSFRVEDNGVLYLTVGVVETPQGRGAFDSAVSFCPFCSAPIPGAPARRKDS